MFLTTFLVQTMALTLKPTLGIVPPCLATIQAIPGHVIARAILTILATIICTIPAVLFIDASVLAKPCFLFAFGIVAMLGAIALTLIAKESRIATQCTYAVFNVTHVV